MFPEDERLVDQEYLRYKNVLNTYLTSTCSTGVYCCVTEALKKCYPLDASDSFVSTYDKWLLLSESMRKTIKVDPNNIALLRKQFSEVLIASADEYGDMPEENEEELLVRLVKTFTYKYNTSRDFDSNREFYNDLKKALEADEAYEAKPTLLKLLAITQVVMNSWEKDAYTASLRARLNARVQSLPPIPTTLSTRAPTLLEPQQPQSISGQEHSLGPRRQKPFPDACLYHGSSQGGLPGGRSIQQQL